MKVLLLADDCNPDWPSLPVVGYNTVRALSEKVELVLVTHIRNQINIERAGHLNCEILYINNEYVASPMHKLSNIIRGKSGTGWTTAIAFSYISYLAFEFEAWKMLKARIDAGEFDLVHRITPMSPTLPSYIVTRLNIPFVIGPINGGLKWPKGFASQLSRERDWLTYLRSTYKLLPFVRKTYKQSHTILAAFRHTIMDMPVEIHGKIIEFPEVGVDENIFKQKTFAAGASERTIIFAGRLVPYKMPDVVVEAFLGSELLSRSHKLVIIGDGPEKARLERMVSKSANGSNVHFKGWRTQSQISEEFVNADIFAFPSIRELGAGVIVEAMASGLVCVVVDYGAPGELITNQRGVKVPLSDRGGLVHSFREALEDLVENQHSIIEKGLEAQSYAVSEFSWTVKAERLIVIYKRITNTGEL